MDTPERLLTIWHRKVKLMRRHGSTIRLPSVDGLLLMNTDEMKKKSDSWLDMLAVSGHAASRIDWNSK